MSAMAALEAARAAWQRTNDQLSFEDSGSAGGLSLSTPDVASHGDDARAFQRSAGTEPETPLASRTDGSNPPLSRSRVTAVGVSEERPLASTTNPTGHGAQSPDGRAHRGPGGES